MKNGNIFEGNSEESHYAKIIYRLLMTQQWVSYRLFVETKRGELLPNQLQTKIPGYVQAKKAFMQIKQLLEDKHPNCIEMRGNVRNKQFRYIHEDTHPLDDLAHAMMIRDLHVYFDFCQDSAGLLPREWADYFFKDTMDLLEIKRKQSNQHLQLIASEEVMLHNIELLPYIYRFVKKKEPFRVKYHPFGKDERTYIMHPHFLREYNGRWFVLGFVDSEKHGPVHGFTLALDRINDIPEKVSNVAYVAPDMSVYKPKFEHQIGVSKGIDDDDNIYNVRVRVYNRYHWLLIQTKKYHPTQRTLIDFGSHDDGEYGEIEIQVRINHELIGRLLCYAEAIEIMEPLKLRQLIHDKVNSLQKMYQK